MATNLDKIRRVVETSKAAAAHYGVSWARVFGRVAHLRLGKRFRPKETFLWGLADPRLPRSEIDRHVSRSALYRLQAVHNPMSLTYLTENKAVFYALCAGAGIRSPKLFAVYHPRGGWVRDPREPGKTRLIFGAAEWRRFLADEGPDSFVVKPARGVYARGLRVLTRTSTGDELLEPSGNSITPAELIEAMAADPRYDTWLLQERLDNDPALRRLSGSRALQTARVVTFVGDDRRPRVLFACMKVIASEHLSDNFDYGTSGNLLANLELESGRLEDVKGKHPSGFGLTTHDAHPQTGVSFEGFVLPHWLETRELAEQAALQFLPLRTIGWDIAITPGGPSILEGNVWWDPLHNAHQLVPRYLETFR